MAASHHSSEGRSRSGRMLRTALGSAICRFLEDAAIVELMRPHLIDRLSEGLPDTGKRLSTGDGERIVRLAAHHVGAEVHASAPRVSGASRDSRAVRGTLPPVVAAPAFAIRKPAAPVFTLDDYVRDVPYRRAKPRHFGWASPPALTSSWLAGLRPSRGAWWSGLLMRTSEMRIGEQAS